MRNGLTSSRLSLRNRHRIVFILCASLFGCLALATPSSVTTIIGGLRAFAGKLVSAQATPPLAAFQRGQRPRPTPCNSCPPPSSKRIYAPAIELREAERCEIVLNSRSASPIEVTPTFYTVNGNAVVGDPVTLQPAEIRFVPVQELMPEALRGRHRWGGIALSYKFVFHYDASLSHDPLMLLRRLVFAYHREIGAANFQVEKSDRAFHIIPVAVRGVSGKQVLDRSPLNIVIALPIKVRTALQELEEICATIGQLTHRRLVVGTIPIGMFAKSLGKRGGSRIIARRALDDLLEKTGNGVKLSWRLLYGPDTKMYALNIHAVR